MTCAASVRVFFPTWRLVHSVLFLARDVTPYTHTRVHILTDVQRGAAQSARLPAQTLSSVPPPPRSRIHDGPLDLQLGSQRPVLTQQTHATLTTVHAEQNPRRPKRRSPSLAARGAVARGAAAPGRLTQGTRRGISSRRRHGRQEATVAAGSSGRARTRRGRGGSRRRTRSRRTCGSRARAHGAASAAGIATDGRRRRRWRVRAGNVAPVAGGELLQAEVQHAGLHTRLSCARRARQHAAAAGACSGDSAGGFERARLAPVAGEPLSSGSPSVSGGRDSNMRGSAAHEGRTAWHQLRASQRTPGGVGGGGSRGSVAPVANGPWEAMRFVPLVHAGRGEGVGGAWVASSASAIF